MVKPSLCHPGAATHPFEVAATAMLPLSLQPGYDYFDGKVEVYGRFGKPGDFTPDPKYTPQLVEDVRAELGTQ
jgi:hypothetical protein